MFTLKVLPTFITDPSELVSSESKQTNKQLKSKSQDLNATSLRWYLPELTGMLADLIFHS